MLKTLTKKLRRHSLNEIHPFQVKVSSLHTVKWLSWNSQHKQLRKKVTRVCVYACVRVWAQRGFTFVSWLAYEPLLTPFLFHTHRAAVIPSLIHPEWPQALSDGLLHLHHLWWSNEFIWTYLNGIWTTFSLLFTRSDYILLTIYQFWLVNCLSCLPMTLGRYFNH